MKTVLKNHLITTIILYTIIYVCYSFVYFEFENPFQWIVDISSKDIFYRGNVLAIFLTYHMCSLVMWGVHHSEKNGK